MASYGHLSKSEVTVYIVVYGSSSSGHAFHSKIEYAFKYLMRIKIPAKPLLE